MFRPELLKPLTSVSAPSFGQGRKHALAVTAKWLGRRYASRSSWGGSASSPFPTKTQPFSRNSYLSFTLLLGHHGSSGLTVNTDGLPAETLETLTSSTHPSGRASLPALLPSDSTPPSRLAMVAPLPSGSTAGLATCLSTLASLPSSLTRPDPMLRSPRLWNQAPTSPWSPASLQALVMSSPCSRRISKTFTSPPLNRTLRFAATLKKLIQTRISMLMLFG